MVYVLVLVLLRNTRTRTYTTCVRTLVREFLPDFRMHSVFGSIRRKHREIPKSASFHYAQLSQDFGDFRRKTNKIEPEESERSEQKKKNKEETGKRK